jgi:alkyl sulfatase BDS1-like metallo-beta-lactamase superfamily hydrolase
MTRSFDTHDRNVVTAPNGARVHKDHLAQSSVIARKLYEVRPGAWCLVGNGLSNQTFIDAPEGVIAIDTGESVEEMALALRELRKLSDRRIAAVLYTHFHYVEGTQAILDEGHCAKPLPIYGHPRIAINKARTSGEIAPAYGRGVVEQFAIAMPTEGADGTVNVGLGFHFRNAEHAPFTPGYIPVTHELPDTGTLTIGGLKVVAKHSPSDSDDSVNFLFPEIDVCVHNTVWPTLFNVFAIRGEEYRDPRVLIPGIENIIAWAPLHLIATHGPPLAGRENIVEKSERYRDSIQFLWDQTVRGINKGWTMDEIATRVRLPDLYDQDYLTSERYGVAEHHVRQIFTGLRGWFDGDESKLFPLEPEERFTRLIAGFGGRAEVAAQARAALASDDLRWGIELATWLVRSPGAAAADRELLARALRLVAERTPAANIRNWAITRARHRDRSTPMDRFYGHGFSPKGMAHASAVGLVHTLRVLLDPAKAAGVNAHAAFAVDGETAGLHVRNCVAVPTDGTGASGTASMSRATLLSLLSDKTRWPDAEIEISGDASRVDAVRRCFEHPGFSG